MPFVDSLTNRSSSLTGSGGSRVPGWRPRLLSALAVFGAGLLLTQYLVSAYAQTVREQLREQTVLHAAAMRARLESALDSTAFLAQGLVAYIRSVDTIRPASVEEALRAVVQADHRLRNVGLAPDNVLTYIYPLQGNEAAVHLDFRTTPKQWPSVQRAMELRHSVLAGPVDLVQGGRGIVCRTPVYLDDGRYWGIISVVIDLDRLLSDVQLQASVDGLNYYLQGDNAGAPGADVAIVGSPEATADDPVRMRLDVPGGHWTLAAVPAGGWGVSGSHLAALRLAGTVLSLLLAWLLWLLLLSRAVARLNSARLTALNEQLNAANRQLGEISRKDELTGIANRRHFDEVYAHDWSQCRRFQMPVSVLMIDIDRFKQINDSHGHAAGDDCLVEAARRLGGVVRRASELLARYGGEEFVVLSPGLHHDEAMALGERLRAAVDAPCTLERDGELVQIAITASIGVATITPTGTMAQQDLLNAADDALYRAKRSGRNCVQSAEPTVAAPERIVGNGHSRSVVYLFGPRDR
ncbi:MAG: diguanylate cyclase [Nevskia sp.]|nr:diguanylate cyclase [Nevskia sp.]